MTACEHLRPSLGAFVLGALDPEEADQVRRHLGECPQCATEHDSLAMVPALLQSAGGAAAATEAPLSSAFEERLLDAFARDRAEVPRRRQGRFGWLRRRARPVLALGVAAVAAVAAVIVLTGGEDAAPRYDLSLAGTAAAPTASAGVQLEAVPGGTEVHLWVRGMKGDPTAVYEVMCEAPDFRASAGTFRVGAEGRTYVILTTAARRGEYDSIRIVRRTRDAAGELVSRDVLTGKVS